VILYLLAFFATFSAARIYAENAIREKTQALNFIRMSSRVDAVAARLETAIRMQQVSAAMGQTVKGMSNVMKSMDVIF
jgi:charged multivesicular body protein 1